VKYFDWDDAKNAKLRAERGIGFEDVVFHIERGDLLDILERPEARPLRGQRDILVRREDCVYQVPFPAWRRWFATDARRRLTSS